MVTPNVQIPSIIHHFLLPIAEQKMHVSIYRDWNPQCAEKYDRKVSLPTFFFKKNLTGFKFMVLQSMEIGGTSEAVPGWENLEWVEMSDIVFIARALTTFTWNIVLVAQRTAATQGDG